MRADDLVVLLEIARCGSLVGAASTLSVDHSTISRRVSALEAELHAPVIIRRVQGCVLTDLGRSLLKPSEEIERALAEVRQLASTGPREPELSGLVRIATTPAFGAHFITPLLADLHRTNPKLVVEIVNRTRLAAHGVGADIEIGVGEPIASRPGAAKLSDYRLGLYASEQYERELGLPAELSELAHHSLIYYVESLLRVDELDLLTRLAGTHRVAFGATSVQDQLRAAIAGAGIALLPAFVAEPEPTLRRVLPSEVSLTLPFFTCLAPRRLRRPAATAIMHAIRGMVIERQGELMPEWVERVPSEPGTL